MTYSCRQIHVIKGQPKFWVFSPVHSKLLSSFTMGLRLSLPFASCITGRQETKITTRTRL